jgi:carboxyl-terminal processing protease
MNKFIKGLVILGVVSFALSANATASIHTTTPSATQLEVPNIAPKDMQRLAVAIAIIKKYYVKPVDDKTLFDNAIGGMLSGLDPHSEYLKKEDLDDLEMLTFGKFGGVGIELVPDQGLLKVISPLDDTPAFKEGIKAGDIIAQINGKLVKDMTMREAISLMRGPKGSKLTLTILRKNQLKPITFNITRDVIKLKTVKTKILEKEYAYIRISFFQEPTEEDLIKAIDKLKKDTNNHIKGIILDLRNNPGGLLDSAVQISDNFLDASKLKQNNLIVYTKGKDSGSESQITAKASTGELFPDVPIVVLINEGSASASEIVAGALQDHKRAIIVGTKSFGKGSVQTLLPVDDQSAIKITTALYYTPLGRSIQIKGIEPDVVVSDIKITAKNNDPEFLAKIDEASLRDHLPNGNSGTDIIDKEQDGNKDEISELKPQNTIDLASKDYQLYEALNILKVQGVLGKK